MLPKGLLVRGSDKGSCARHSRTAEGHILLGPRVLFYLAAPRVRRVRWFQVVALPGVTRKVIAIRSGIKCSSGWADDCTGGIGTPVPGCRRAISRPQAIRKSGATEKGGESSTAADEADFGCRHRSQAFRARVIHKAPDATHRAGHRAREITHARSRRPLIRSGGTLEVTRRAVNRGLCREFP